MPNTAQRSAEYEILSLLRRRFCRWRRFFLHGVREESADCGRWSEKAKRETRKVAKAYGKEAQQIVVIRGHCTGLEKTPMRRRIKTLYLWSDPHTVKIHIAGRLRNVDEGDIITVYTATGTPVYENEGCQQLSTYLAIDILKGRGSK